MTAPDAIRCLRERADVFDAESVPEVHAALAAVQELYDSAREVEVRLEREDDPTWDSPSELDALVSAVRRVEAAQ